MWPHDQTVGAVTPDRGPSMKVKAPVDDSRPPVRRSDPERGAHHVPDSTGRRRAWVWALGVSDTLWGGISKGPMWCLSHSVPASILFSFWNTLPFDASLLPTLRTFARLPSTKPGPLGTLWSPPCRPASPGCPPPNHGRLVACLHQPITGEANG